MTEPTGRDREMRKAFVEDTFPGCSQIDVGDHNLAALDRLLAAAREKGRREAIEECMKKAAETEAKCKKNCVDDVDGQEWHEGYRAGCRYLKSLLEGLK